MPRARKLTEEERRALRGSLHDLVEQGGQSWSRAIRQMRQALGLTQLQFGQVFGMSRRQVLDLEAGTTNPTVETLTRIGRPFGFEIGYILRAPEPPPAAPKAAIPGETPGE